MSDPIKCPKCGADLSTEVLEWGGCNSCDYDEDDLTSYDEDDNWIEDYDYTEGDIGQDGEI